MRRGSLALIVGVDDRVVICTISRGEILLGLERLSPGRRRDDLEQKAYKMFAILPSKNIPVAAGDRYAHVKASQQRRGLPLDESDLQIDATALAMEATLVSGNGDFRLIEGLAFVEP